jgi:hypothetical protein
VSAPVDLRPNVASPSERRSEARRRAVRARIRARIRRAFTLVELVVALTAGIAVAGAAYILSKNSLSVFESEARMSQAQFGATMGLNRLVNDLQRAGFMANPNFVEEPGKGCGDRSTFGLIKAIAITSGGSSTTAPASALNLLDPDSIRLVGNFFSTEQFAFRTLQGTTIYMSMLDGAMQRTLKARKDGGPALDEIFRQDRYVRVVDGHGKETYVKIASISCTPNCSTWNITAIQLQLVNTPMSDGMVCGDWVSGGLINPVGIIDYHIGQPTVASDGISAATLDLVAPQNNDPKMAAIVAQTGDLYRTELIRRELYDNNGTAALMPAVAGLPAPGEVVAEYAVDLKFSATIRTPGDAPTIKRLDGDTDGADIETTPAQQFVGLMVRLSTRGRAPDRSAGLTSNPRARFNVFATNPMTAGQADHFARVRTLVQEVTLPNLGGIKW